MTLFVIQKAEHSQQLLYHINKQDSDIQFKVEEADQDGSLPFLDTKVTPEPNNTLIITVYRKPTHTDQYLYWDSDHHIAAKYSVYNTAAHRAKVVSSNQPSLTKQLEHSKMALQSYHFPTWALNKLQHNFECRHYNNNEPSSTDSQHNNSHNNNGANINNKNISIMVLYVMLWIGALGAPQMVSIKSLSAPNGLEVLVVGTPSFELAKLP